MKHKTLGKPIYVHYFYSWWCTISVLFPGIACTEKVKRQVSPHWLPFFLRPIIWMCTTTRLLCWSTKTMSWTSDSSTVVLTLIGCPTSWTFSHGVCLLSAKKVKEKIRKEIPGKNLEKIYQKKYWNIWEKFDQKNWSKTQEKIDLKFRGKNWLKNWLKNSGKSLEENVNIYSIFDSCFQLRRCWLMSLTFALTTSSCPTVTKNQAKPKVSFIQSKFTFTYYPCCCEIYLWFQ